LKKVLVISDYSKLHSTRPEASIFIELAKKGYEIHIMTYENSPLEKQFLEVGISVIPFHPSKKFDEKETERIREYLIKHSIEILQLYNSNAIIQGLKAAKGLDVKIVLYRGFAGNIYWYDPSSYFKFLHPRVDAVVCNSKGVESYLRKQLIFNKSKAITINKGHNIEWYQNCEAHDIRKELGLSKDAFLLVNVCNNRKMKGIPYLIKAMSMIDSNLDIHLLLIGRNMEDKENKAELDGNKNRDKIHILGFRNDTLSIVKACDCFVLPSIMGESITKSVIEAMSLGIAPIITDIPGNEELVVDGKSGLVVPSKNSTALYEVILKLYTKHELKSKISIQAKEHIEKNLNYKKTAEEMALLYEGL